MRFLPLFLLALAAPLCAAPDPVVVPWTADAFSADEGCAWQSDQEGAPLQNGHYFAPPAPGQNWAEWLAGLRAYRADQRAHPHSAAGRAIHLRFDGMRAWVRLGRSWAFAADLQPGEAITLEGQARWLEGNPTLCLAFDWCDRAGESDGVWRNWSAVLATASIPKDGAWHGFRIPVAMPAFERERCWARPILGMDGTHDTTRGSVMLRSLRLVVPASGERAARCTGLAARAQAPIDDSIYRRPDLRWMASNFVCGFLMVNDRAFWDPERRRYRVPELCAEAEREFGGYDSVVLWHAYPRIGADDRTQFDFFRDMPGGLPVVYGSVGKGF